MTTVVRVVAFVAVTATTALVVAPRLGAQDPQVSFRSTADAVAVDVQVVRNDNGAPVTTLGARDFEVVLGGKRREVVSAQLVTYADRSTMYRPLGAGAAADRPTAAPSGPASPRIFIVAIDCLSFDLTDSHAAAEAARRFVRSLNPDDLVGIYAYPLGPKLDPTTDHAGVLRSLSQIVGQKVPATTDEFRVSASDLVDFQVDADARNRVIMRECGGGGGAAFGGRGFGGASAVNGRGGGGADEHCVGRLMMDVQMQAMAYEGQAQMSLSSLGRLFDALAFMPERKLVVLLSAGMPVSDQPGARPDVGDMPIYLGQRAAHSKSTLYSLYIDSAFLGQYSAAARSAPSLANVSRDGAVLRRWLDLFSGAAGGTVMPVQVDSGDVAFARILRETSAYYLLAVRPEIADRDGKPREIKVRVNERGATVRARRWVVVPARRTPG